MSSARKRTERSLERERAVRNYTAPALSPPRRDALVNFLTPSRLPLESRPLRDEPPPRFVAVRICVWRPGVSSRRTVFAALPHAPCHSRRRGGEGCTERQDGTNRKDPQTAPGGGRRPARCAQAPRCGRGGGRASSSSSSLVSFSRALSASKTKRGDRIFWLQRDQSHVAPPPESAVVEVARSGCRAAICHSPSPLPSPTPRH